MKSIPERLSPEELIVFAAKFIYERNLTDVSGGNISLRVENRLYLSPTLAGTLYHWQIGPEDIVVGTVENMEEIKLDPRFTREGLSHLAIYKAFPFVGAIIHAHPKFVNPFVAVSKPIPPLLSSARHFGELQYHEEAESYSQDQAEKIIKVLKGQEERMKKKAAIVLMPRHGLIAASMDIMTAMDCVERVNTNAFSVMAQKWID